VQDIAKVSGLFGDLEAAVLPQGEAIERIAQAAETTKDDVEQSNRELDGGLRLAISHRQKRKWLIIASIAVAAAVFLAVYFGIKK